MKVDFIRSSYVRFHQKHRKEILQAIDRCLSKGSVIMESEVEKFENSFAKFCKRKYCISLRSGTDALNLAMWYQKPNIFSHYAYRLEEPKIYINYGRCFLVTYMNSSISEQVGAKIEREKGYFIIEDACQAVGRKLIGDISCFSLYPAKMLGGIGKGGALVTDNQNIYKEIKAKRDDKWNNLWLDEVKASYLNMKLKYLPDMLKRREEIAKMYYKELPSSIQPIAPDMLQNFVVEVETSKEFFDFMRKKEIEVIMDKNDFYVGSSKKWVRLPIYPELTNEEVRHVIKCANEYGR